MRSDVGLLCLSYEPNRIVQLPSTEGQNLVSIFQKYQADVGYHDYIIPVFSRSLNMFWIGRRNDNKRKKSNADDDVGAAEQTKKKKKTAVKEEVVDEDELPIEQAPKPVEKESKKKTKKGKSAEAAEEEESCESPATKPAAGADGGGSAKKGGGATASPFQRVKAEEVTYLKVKGGQAEAQRLKDNTFESKVPLISAAAVFTATCRPPPAAFCPPLPAAHRFGWRRAYGRALRPRTARPLVPFRPARD